MRHLHGDRRAVDQHDFVAPVELVRLARRKAQRHVAIHRRRCTIALPSAGIPPDGIVAALIAAPAKLLENPDQRQAFAAWVCLVWRPRLIEGLPPRAGPWEAL